jgi:hypothetical protein
VCYLSLSPSKLLRNAPGHSKTVILRITYGFDNNTYRNHKGENNPPPERLHPPWKTSFFHGGARIETQFSEELKCIFMTLYPLPYFYWMRLITNFVIEIKSLPHNNMKISLTNPKPIPIATP